MHLSVVRNAADIHNRAAQRIARKMPCNVADEWIYPPLEEAHKDAGVCTLCTVWRRDRT